MLIPYIRGTYYWGQKLSACRISHCYHCRRPTIFDGIRAFTVGHLFWIPLIPIGFRTRWFCNHCKKPPNDPTGNLAMAFIFGGLVFYFGCIFIYYKEFKPGLVSILIGASIPTLVHFFGPKKVKVQPYTFQACPYCKSPLLTGKKPKCQKCKITVHNRLK